MAPDGEADAVAGVTAPGAAAGDRGAVLEPETQAARPAEQEVLADAAAVAARAAALFVDAAQHAVAERGRFVVALAGGSTPRAAYELLAGEAGRAVDWARVHVWFGDERCVPPEHALSNYRAAREALLDRVPVPAAQVLRIEGEREPDDAAARYDALLRGDAAMGASFGGGPAAPHFDLVLLGVGPDGHTASLFPGGAALDARERWAVAVPAPEAVAPHVPRVTLTRPALESARLVLGLAVGADKRGPAAAAVAGAPDGLPAGRVRGQARTVWLLDTAASSGE